MALRSRWALLAALLVAALVAVLVAGQRGEPPPVSGVQRLGPEASEPVAGYLRRAKGSLPPSGSGDVWALVQLAGYLDPVAAASLVAEVRLSGVVLRVPLPRVQTALIFRDLPGQRPATELADAMRAAAREQTRRAAQAPTGSRRSAVAAAESARLGTGCRCVLAVLVRADGAALRTLAGQSRVRAVHAADPGTPLRELAISPLLPEQQKVAGPVPDDGQVPP